MNGRIIIWPGVSLRLFIIGFSLAYGICMVSLNGFDSWSRSTYHTSQAKALIAGHLSLGNSIYQIEPDLAWCDGHVQQVWGLGVGFWLLPFQFISDQVSFRFSPEPFAMGAAFALLAGYCLSTARRLQNNSETVVTATGFVWIILLCPPLWCIARGSQLVFEETVIYATIISLATLIALYRCAYFGSLFDFYVCCTLSGITGFVRPTHMVYAVAGALAGGTIMLKKGRPASHFAAGGCIFLALFLSLGVTNWLRFGSVLEFGHNLTLTTPGLVYLTRFGSPFHETGLLNATKELFGLLFMITNPGGNDAFGENLFYGQAVEMRWRSLYMSTFDLSYFVVAVLAAPFAMKAFVKIISERGQYGLQLASSIVFAWSCISMGALILFYLYFETMASRYLLDFAPAFVGLFLVIWLPLSRILPRVSLSMLAVWQLSEILLATVLGSVSFQSAEANLMNKGVVVGKPLLDFGGNYTIFKHPSQTAIPFNGKGWDPISGFADDIVMVAVDHPKFVELVVGDRVQDGSLDKDPDFYSAKINNRVLPVEEIMRTGGRVTVRFGLPAKMQTGDEFLFLCFSSQYELYDRQSYRLLYSITWR